MRSRSSISWRSRSSRRATRFLRCRRWFDDCRSRSRKSSAISRTPIVCLLDWTCANVDSVMNEQYVLRLYVTGMTPRSARAVENLRSVCDEFLEGRYDLEVIDIYQQPALTKGEQIIAAPTLIKKLPLPVRRLVGDMSDRERVLVGLDLVSAHAPGRSGR